VSKTSAWPVEKGKWQRTGERQRNMLAILTGFTGFLNSLNGEGNQTCTCQALASQ